MWQEGNRIHVQTYTAENNEPVLTGNFNETSKLPDFSTNTARHDFTLISIIIHKVQDGKNSSVGFFTN